MLTCENKWNITYLNEAVIRDISNLPVKIRARYFALTDTMEIIGPNLGMPHTRAMGDGLFELRVKAQEGIARFFYCTQIKNEIVMLHCFIKKTDKTPPKELRMAKKRFREVK